MRRIDFIVIHCAATKPDMDIGVSEIRGWHLQRGFADIGYHRVIRRDGSVEQGRADTAAGAHVAGYNSHSLAICLVGGIDDRGNAADNYTDEQWLALAELVREAQETYGVPNDRVFGHRDMPSRAGVPLGQIAEGTGFAKVRKDCPCFDVREWLRGISE